MIFQQEILYKELPWTLFLLQPDLAENCLSRSPPRDLARQPLLEILGDLAQDLGNYFEKYSYPRGEILRKAFYGLYHGPCAKLSQPSLLEAASRDPPKRPRALILVRDAARRSCTG